ncbi:MAG: hypothetical protein DRI57_00935 [Deltaproteobacteria bacterium]|nr:MAG: hypothetical protein DRI57_00935 [Deltaproteobacteria bacterium]
MIHKINDYHVAQIQIPLLKNKARQQEINDLVLEANAKRYEAYTLEQEAITMVNKDVIYREA